MNPHFGELPDDLQQETMYYTTEEEEKIIIFVAIWSKAKLFLHSQHHSWLNHEEISCLISQTPDKNYCQ